MEVMKGYKQTELGIFPCDWEIKKIGDVAELYGRIGFRGYTVNDIVKEGYGAITISPSNIQGEIMNFKKCTYISWFKYQESPEIKIYNGDILLVKTGSTFGKSALVKNLNEKATINPQIVVFKKLKINNVLFSKIISNPIVQEQITSSIVGGAIPTLSQRLVLNFKIPLPPTEKEQTAIANALSDTDSWINSLEQLLTKKRQIKQGAMQELLQPKEGWEVKSLGETFDVLADYTANGSFETLKNNVRYYSQTNYSVLVRTTDLDKKVFEPERFTDKQGYNFLSKTSLFGGELIIANVGSIGKVFKVPYYNMKMTLAPNTYMIKFNKKTSQEFIYQWMLTEEFRTKLMAKVGSTTLLAINKDNLRDIILNIPKDFKEQARIASILSDMDDEIAQLETKLSKAKQIKQGMMQELLTGRIRLV